MIPAENADGLVDEIEAWMRSIERRNRSRIRRVWRWLARQWWWK